MDDQQVYYQWVDVVLFGKVQCDWVDDCDCCWVQCIECGEYRGDYEYYLWDGYDMVVYGFYSLVYQQVDGVVFLCDGEQVGDVDQGQEQIVGKVCQDFFVVYVDLQFIDDEG